MDWKGDVLGKVAGGGLGVGEDTERGAVGVVVEWLMRGCKKSWRAGERG